LPVCLPVVFFSPASKKNKVGGQSRLEQLQETHHSRTFFLRLLRCCCWKEKEKKKREAYRTPTFHRQVARDCLCFLLFLNGWQRWKFGIDTFAGWEKKKKS
jgi:hypothetical protein